MQFHPAACGSHCLFPTIFVLPQLPYDLLPFFPSQGLLVYDRNPDVVSYRVWLSS